MTLTKKKFRYLAIFIPSGSFSSRSLISQEISKRFVDLFGTIESSNTRNRIIKSDGLDPNIVIIKCTLETLTDMILSIYSVKEDLILIAISGTLKQLKRKSHAFLIHLSETPSSSSIFGNMGDPL